MAGILSSPGMSSLLSTPSGSFPGTEQSVMYREALLPDLPAALSLMALLTRQRLLMGLLIRRPCDHCSVCRAECWPNSGSG